ncbi:cation:proton antiporter [Roseomonas sp. NAR14]|uniref:Cation:proton antiporter n=1 Tax=Roseomonas acroporae TaxID=2937791 RepID=A0A9X1Y9T0_9PROT|nr:cation:proton antiporter [Roseomonas acroporae]MCK8785767.1 cation:proton antiporter [Roseomonas acroporae]
MLTELPDTLLVIAVLLVIVSAIQPLARRLLLSDSVLLAMVGVMIGGVATLLLHDRVAGVLDEAASRVTRLPVNAEVFLLVFLPLLVFHGALRIDVRRLARDAAPVLVMAVVAVLVTTFAIGYALHPLAGGVPLAACLMLGAIVATTDPSAVVGVFRDIGADGRLTRLVEGESLLNDAAAIALFTMLLSHLAGGAPLDPLTAARDFVLSFGGGMLAGFLLARLVLAAIPWLGGNRAAETTLTLALPYLAYIIDERFLHVSGVVAAATAGLTLSAAGPSTFRPQSWTFLHEVWDQLAFWASSLVFVLAAMLVPKLMLGMDRGDLALVGVVVLAATAARALVLFTILPTLRWAGLCQRVPIPFKVTMLWGGLRGAITLALALAVTENPAVPPRIQQFVAILATGFVLFSLLVNGTTLPFLVRALKLDRLSPADQALRNQVVAIGLGEVRDRLRRMAGELGFSAPATAPVLDRYERRIRRETAANTFDTAISDRERVTLGLITFASQERALLLEIFRERGISRRVIESMLWTSESMLDGARAGGRHGYVQAARRRLQPTLRFRFAQRVHRRFRYDRLLMHAMAERFEMLQITHVVSVAMTRFMRERMEPVLGRRVTEIVADIVARRDDMLQDAIDTLRLQYPGYAEALERRMLRQIGLRLEAEEYVSLHRESLIGEELFQELMRGLEAAAGQVSRPLRFNLQAGLDRRLKEFPAFASLQEAALHDLALSVTLRFAVPGERLYRAGQRADAVYLVSAGEVEVVRDGQEVRLGRDSVFGAEEVLAGTHRQGRARAVGFCHLLELAAADFLRLAEEAPEMPGRIGRLAAGTTPEAVSGTPSGTPSGAVPSARLVAFDPRRAMADR